MVEMDQSAAHNLAMDAAAELNAAKRPNEETLAIYRGAGEKFIKIRELLGRLKYLKFTARATRMSERQIQRIIQLAESPKDTPAEEQMAILWGNPVAQSAGSAPKKPKSIVAFQSTKWWSGYNRIADQNKAFGKEFASLADEPAYKAIVDALGIIKARFRELEKKVGE